MGADVKYLNPEPDPECFARNKDAHIRESWCAFAMECDEWEVVSSGNWWSRTRESQSMHCTMAKW